MRKMRKCIIITSLVALCLMALTTTAFAATGTVNVNSLVLREKMSTQSDALQTLPKGTELNVISKDGNWYKVKYGRYTGYVMTRYVKVVGNVPAADAVETLRKGMRGDAVKAMQERLEELGYYDDECSGYFGNNTFEAVKAFQKRNGLEVDGIAGPATLKKLDSSSARKAAATSNDDNKADAKDDDTLRPGDSGSAVRALQTRLRALGYFNHSVDGKYDSQVTEAVKAFQRRNGLTADGIAGAKTLNKLNSSSAKKADGSEAENDSDEENLTLDIENTYLIGDRNDEIKKMQKRLTELGYFSGSCTGYYGTATRNAVLNFQKRNNLYVDGIAGRSTLRALNKSSAKPASAPVVSESNNNSSSTDDSALRPGDSGSAVKTLQTRLRELGYFNHSVDGKYDSQVTEAVKAFQKRNGLYADGIAGAKTLAKLTSQSAKPAAGASDSTNDSSEDASNDATTLRPGMTGSAVKALQTRLRALGYFDHSLDSKYDSQVTEAVKAFQKGNGLYADGIAGPATLAKLNSSSAKPAAGASNDKEDEKEEDTTTLRPGMTGSKVRTLQARLRTLGYFNHSVDGKYDSQVTEAVKAFQKRNGLYADGIAGEKTLEKLYGNNAKPAAGNTADKDDNKNDNDKNESTGYKTERLDWYNGGASRIPRGATFTIKDVRTGKTFQAKRQGGSDHLDAEPLTAADSAVLLSINGGSYSYRRRPMLVLYNGRVYACSIYSEPHGSDTIPNNNFEGQFCLHFYGCKTHGTQRVDADHQACEAEALRATW